MQDQEPQHKSSAQKSLRTTYLWENAEARLLVLPDPGAGGGRHGLKEREPVQQLQQLLSEGAKVHIKSLIGH